MQPLTSVHWLDFTSLAQQEVVCLCWKLPFPLVTSQLRRLLAWFVRDVTVTIRLLSSGPNNSGIAVIVVVFTYWLTLFAHTAIKWCNDFQLGTSYDMWHRNNSHLGLVHTTLEEFQNWDFNLKSQQSSAILKLCLRKTRSGQSRDYRDVIVVEKLSF